MSEKIIDHYTQDGRYKRGIDPEVTCWHCGQTFLCDAMDATCRMCDAPYSRKRCKEFNFTPNWENVIERVVFELKSAGFKGSKAMKELLRG